MNLLKEILGSNIKFAIIVLEINNGISFKDITKRQDSAIVKARIGVNIPVHIETIKKQYVSVKRALKEILASKILVDRYKINLKLML